MAYIRSRRAENESEEGRFANRWDWPLNNQAEFAEVTNTRDRFEVELEVPQFSQNEIDVQVNGNELFVNCVKEDRRDKKQSRQINRAYRLPADVDASSIRSKLNDKGVLQISADKKRR